MKFDLRQLRHLLAIERHRNFTRAAEAVGLTQPALTRSLQMLEKSVGARLFDRHRSHVEPTAVGARLVEHARALLDQVLGIERDLEQMQGLETGLLRVGSGPFAAEVSMGTAVGRLLRRHPNLQVDLAVGDWPAIMSRVVSGEFDLAVAEVSPALDDARLAVEPLPRHRGVLYCRAGHPLAGRGELSLDDVRQYPIALSAIPPRMAPLLTSGPGRSECRPSAGIAGPQVRAETPFLTRRIVMESDALSAALPSQIAAELALGQLVVLPLELPWLETQYGVIRRADRTASPAAAAFVQILREVESAID